MRLQDLNRFHAFCGHLLVSSFVALLSAMLVFFLWYPGPLALASGVRGIYLLLLFVDVVLGPVITLIVFNPKKKELRRDLAVVVLVQLAALLYGLHTVWIARPVYVVFSMDRFDLVYANDFTKEKLAKVTKVEYQSMPLLGPKLIAARQPDDPKARNELLFGSLSGGDDLAQSPQYYVPYLEQKANVLKRSQPLAVLKQFNHDKTSAIDAMVSQYAARKIDVGYLPLKGKVKDLVVIVNRKTAEVLEIVDLTPWS